MTHTKPCKFCGLPVTVQSDPDCPQEWAESLLKMLSCNRCADYRSAMGQIGAEIRKVCLGMIQMINGKVSTPDREAGIRKILERLTWKVAEATCRFYRIKTIYDQDFVDQIMEHPDKSSAILRTYAGLVRQEARQQRQQHEQRIEPSTSSDEAVPIGDSPSQEDQAPLSLQEHAQGQLAVAKAETNQPAGSAGQDQRRGVSEQTVFI